MTYQLEVFAVEEMCNVAFGPCEEIVDADKFGPALQQMIAQMRAEKIGPAGCDNCVPDACALRS